MPRWLKLAVGIVVALVAIVAVAILYMPLAGTRAPTHDGRPVMVRRYPNIEGPDRVASGQQFSVQVSLTMDPLSSGIQVAPGPDASVDGDGRLNIRMPPRPNGEPWPIDVFLSAPYFEVEGGNQGRIAMPPEGDSTPALFKLRPKSGAGTGAPAKVSVTFWLEGTYLARATRTIGIGDTAAAAAPVTSGRANISSLEAPADLTVYVQESRVGDRTVCQFTIESPFLQPGTAPCISAEELRPWLSEQYSAVMRASQSFRGVRTATGDPAATLDQSTALMRGIGRELYRRAAGALFDDAFWKLVARQEAGGHPFRTIQIYTNNPSLPWELMVPVHEQRARDGFLGTEFQVARWHITEEVSARDKPPQRLALRQVDAIVPAYSGALSLSHQSEEISTLQQLPGFQNIKGEFASIQQLLRNPPEGIVHFAGHGVATPGGGGTANYAIQLEGGSSLDLTSWRGLVHDDGTHHPLYFVNACDLGQTNRVLNFVDGWAPAVLEGGASGFIGGLWPLSDKGAAAFANLFYKGMMDGIGGNGSAAVAELLTGSRQEFFRSGDPTFLAYVFYGDVNLRVSR